MAKCPWYSGCNGKQGCTSKKFPDVTFRELVNIDDKVCEGKQVNGKRYTDCPKYRSTYYKKSTGNRKCPHAVVITGGWYDVVRCNSPANPKAKKRVTKVGVDYNRCAEGRRENGKTYTQCPYYTREKARSLSKKELRKITRATRWNRLHESERRLVILLIIIFGIALYSVYFK